MVSLGWISMTLFAARLDQPNTLGHVHCLPDRMRTPGAAGASGEPNDADPDAGLAFEARARRSCLRGWPLVQADAPTSGKEGPAPTARVALSAT
jgi:hypothetical protein